MTDIELSWPAKALWPNGDRAHYMVVSRARKAAKNEAYVLTQVAKSRSGWKWDGGAIPVHIKAHPKTAHTVDAQNLIAGLKAHFDGIANGLGIDDKHFAAPTVTFAEPIKHGRIVVSIGE